MRDELKAGMMANVSGRLVELVRPVTDGEMAFSEWTLREEKMDNSKGNLWWVRRGGEVGEVVADMVNGDARCGEWEVKV